MRFLVRGLLLLGIMLFLGGWVFSAALPQWMLGLASDSSEFAASLPFLFALAFSVTFIVAITLGQLVFSPGLKIGSGAA